MEVNAVVVAENKKIHRRKGECRKVGSTEEDLAGEERNCEKTWLKPKMNWKAHRGRQGNPALGISPPVRRVALVVAKRATLSETAWSVRTACRETNPGSWTSERSSHWVWGLGNCCQKKIVCDRESGRNRSGMVSGFQCTLNLISLEVYKKIPEDRRPALEENNVKMRTADGSLLPGHGRMQKSNN